MPICVCRAGLCRVILIILTSQCPILGEREARDGGGRGWERRGRRDVLPPRQTPFKWTTESDQWFPPGVCCIGRPAAQAASVWKQLRVSTQPARGLHSLSGEPALSSYIYPCHRHCFVFPFFLFSSSCVFVRSTLFCVGSSCLVCGCSICEGGRSQAGGEHVGFFFFFFWRVTSMMLSPSMHFIVIYYHKGPLAFKVLPFSPPAVYGSQSITASEDRWALAD